jgi:hypothetical protein
MKQQSVVEICFFRCKFVINFCHPLPSESCNNVLPDDVAFRLAHNYLKKQCDAAAFECAYISDCFSDCDVMQSAQWQVILGFFALASFWHDNFYRVFPMLPTTLFMIRLLW